MSTQSSPITVKSSSSLYVNSQLSGSRRTFYRPVWFSTERRLHLWSFISTALRKKSDLTIDPNGSRTVELFENEKSAQKSNGSNLIQALIRPDSWEVFVGGEGLMSEGVFLIAFLSTNIFRLEGTLEKALTSRELDRLT